MSFDPTCIRVKAMLIAPNDDGARHLVSKNPPTSEHPRGYHRLIGGGVDLGETHREAIIREVDEELGARILDLTYLGVVENIFRYNGELGHEIIALYCGRLTPAPGDDGGTLTETDGSLIPLVWRPVGDTDATVPLFPLGTSEWIGHPKEQNPPSGRGRSGLDVCGSPGPHTPAQTVGQNDVRIAHTARETVQ